MNISISIYIYIYIYCASDASVRLSPYEEVVSCYPLSVRTQCSRTDGRIGASTVWEACDFDWLAAALAPN